MIKLTVTTLLFLCIVSSCTKEEIIPRSYPRVNTLDISNINSSGASFHGDIFYSNVPVRDHGFIWSPYSNMTFEQSDRISLGPNAGAGLFDANIDRGLINGKTYYMRAYAISDDKTVFGDIEKFISKGSPAPVIKDLYPTLVTWGDTLTLVGDNFSVMTVTNALSINNVLVEIIGGNRDTLWTKVDYNLVKEFSDVAINRNGEISICPKQIRLKAPEIQLLSPATGIEGTEVTITGLYLATSIAKVYFNNIYAPLTNLKPNGVVVKVPAGLSAGDVQVKIVIGEGGLFDTSAFKVL